MTTRRDVLKIGALGSLTVAGAGLADVSRASETLPPAPASTLAPANTPVPYAGVFRRRRGRGVGGARVLAGRAAGPPRRG